ncbi:MAG: aspartate aminotransferase family protein [SAR202 cluster bacterium]|jgi:glutamate-1-semialdehyde 2,1-aminomutase|nr:aspartate aminotransferase family protein [SAR202 cluster bacterium]MDP6513487.1 aspartate aminotransferase family protein [SAR202 cluster bacterium]
MSFEKSKQLHERSAQSLAGGVSSNIRLGEKPTPLFFERGEGAHLTDVDGNDYVDYMLGQGPDIFGHSPRFAIDAVTEAMQRGITYAGQHETEIRVSEMVQAAIPGAELVRYASSGTEVVQVVLRLARAYTGRNKFVKFEGHYHGWADSTSYSTMASLDQMGPSDNPTAVPMSLGIESSTADDLIVLPWNDLDAVRRIAEEQGPEIAAIITEPIMCNANCIMPKPGYLEGLRRVCDEHGIVLIFDEVITGFRVSLGGAQELFGVTPDLSTYAKAMAGGFPLAMFAGKREIMSLVADASVLHGGTVNGNNISMAAAEACLLRLQDSEVGALDKLKESGRTLMQGLEELTRKHEIPALFQGPGPVFHMSFTDANEINDYREHAVSVDQETYARFCEGMLERGIRLIGRGVWFTSTEHTEEDIARTLKAADETLAEL